MFCAHRANDDGSGIWWSKGKMAAALELGRRTVIQVINEFVAEGLLVPSGRRACDNGYTVEYDINLTAVSRLEAIPELDREGKATSAATAPVQPEHPTSAATAPPPVQPLHRTSAATAPKRPFRPWKDRERPEGSAREPDLSRLDAFSAEHRRRRRARLHQAGDRT